MKELIAIAIFIALIYFMALRPLVKAHEKAESEEPVTSDSTKKKADNTKTTIK